jgi:DNA-binding transcriptional MerR regulator
MQQTTQFDRTTGQVARDAGVSAPTVRLYANLGLLPHLTASDGTRLFRPDAADLVREICARRLANRGRRAEA